jgi:hypothetical protein
VSSTLPGGAGDQGVTWFEFGLIRFEDYDVRDAEKGAPAYRIVEEVEVAGDQDPTPVLDAGKI